MAEGRKMAKKQVQRKGTPFTLYLSVEQARQLEAVSRKRSIPKAAVVRFAVDRLLTQLGSGQLELPLGIE